jgi:hypothetical protein
MRYIPLLAVAVFLLSISCISTSDAPKVNTADIEPIKKSFSTFIDAMVKGDVKKAYSFTSGIYRKIQSYEEFETDYNKNKADLLLRFQDAFLSNISAVENEATARLKYGTGEETIIEFMKENNIWKIKRMGRRLITPQNQ